MQLYFAGAEVTSHFAILKECGVERVAVSASNLARVQKDKLALWASRARLAGLEWVLYADSAQTPVSIVTRCWAALTSNQRPWPGPIEWYDTTWLQGLRPAVPADLGRHGSGQAAGVRRGLLGRRCCPTPAVDNPVHVRAAKAALPTARHPRRSHWTHQGLGALRHALLSALVGGAEARRDPGMDRRPLRAPERRRQAAQAPALRRRRFTPSGSTWTRS